MARRPVAGSSVAPRRPEGNELVPPGEGGPALVEIGYISKAHGIRGELAFVCTAPDLFFASGPDSWPGSGEIFLRPRFGGAVQRHRVAGGRAHHGALLLRLEGVEDRTAAQRLNSHTVLVRRELLPRLPDGRVCLSDLPGLAVFVLDTEQRARLGVIERAEAPAGQVLWSIRTPEGAEVLFPAVDEFIHSIDPERGEAVICPPPGLLDLYLPS